MVLTDRVEQGDPAISNDPRVTTHTGDLLDSLPVLFDTPFHPFDAVIHLASAVSGECEADFSLGLRANLATTEHLLAYLRRQAEEQGVVAQLFLPVQWRCSAAMPVYRCLPSSPMAHWQYRNQATAPTNSSVNN